MDHLLGALIVMIITSVIMKFTWYDRLGHGKMYLPESDEATHATEKADE